MFSTQMFKRKLERERDSQNSHKQEKSNERADGNVGEEKQDKRKEPGEEPDSQGNPYAFGGL